MAITFIVENGTGVTGATSYATVEQCRQYHLDRGYEITATPDDKIQTALNVATSYVDSAYVFAGCRITSDQSLSWPRADLSDREGAVFSGLPRDVVNAVCYLTGLVLAGTQLDQVDEGISSQSVAGISVTYNNSGLRSFPVVDRLLAPFVIAGARLVRVN